MRIFVAGATGFLGRSFCVRALADGHEVTGLTRRAASAGLPPPVRLVAADDAAALQAGLAASDAVVNLAGESIAAGRWTRARKQALRDSRVALTERLIAAMARAGERPRVVVSASAVGYYGDTGDAVVDEQSPAGGDFLAQLTRDWENAALGAQALGARVVLPRIGVVLGRGGALAKLVPLFRAGLGGRLGSGRQWMSWVHHDDLIDTLLRAITDPRFAGPVNVVAPQPVTNAELTRALGAALHRPTVFTAPAFALRLVLGETATALLGGQRVDCRKLRELGALPRFGSIDAALGDILAERPRGAAA